MLSEKQLQKLHADDASLPRSVISMEFLQSSLRLTFCGETVGGVVKCCLFSQTSHSATHSIWCMPFWLYQTLTRLKSVKMSNLQQYGCTTYNILTVIDLLNSLYLQVVQERKNLKKWILHVVHVFAVIIIPNRENQQVKINLFLHFVLTLYLTVVN